MYKIGEFAKLCNSTSKLIRFYDDVGILKPDYIDDSSNYRYYSGEKVEIFKKIILFREIGFTLKEITQELLYSSDEKIAAVLESRQEELRKKYELCRKLTEEYKEKITMSTDRVQFFKGNKNDSIIINYDDEYVELFTDEQNIAPVIQAFDLMMHVPGYVNLDIADLVYFPTQENARSINYIHFRGEIDKFREIAGREAHPEVKGILVSIGFPPSGHITIEEVYGINNIIMNEFGYSNDLTAIWGAAPDESLSEIDVSIIEFY